MDAPVPNDAAALHAACQPDAAAEGQVAAYEALWAYLYRITFFLVRDQPDAAAMAQDYAQNALLRIHRRLADCREPAAFLGWSRRIATNLVLDDMRRRRRLVPLDEATWDDVTLGAGASQTRRDVETRAGQSWLDQQLAATIGGAPLSDRSRRLVIGRFLENVPDEELAARESALAERDIRPSHIQVTRAKNIAKLRQYGPLLALLRDKAT